MKFLQIEGFQLRYPEISKNTASCKGYCERIDYIFMKAIASGIRNLVCWIGVEIDTTIIIQDMKRESL